MKLKIWAIIQWKVYKDDWTCEKALQISDLKKEEIDEIYLVGGSTRIQRIEKELLDFFKDKVKVWNQ